MFCWRLLHRGVHDGHVHPTTTTDRAHQSKHHVVRTASCPPEQPDVVSDVGAQPSRQSRALSELVGLSERPAQETDIGSCERYNCVMSWGVNKMFVYRFLMCQVYMCM